MFEEYAGGKSLGKILFRFFLPYRDIHTCIQISIVGYLIIEILVIIPVVLQIFLREDMMNITRYCHKIIDLGTVGEKGSVAQEVLRCYIRVIIGAGDG